MTNCAAMDGTSTALYQADATPADCLPGMHGPWRSQEQYPSRDRAVYPMAVGRRRRWISEYLSQPLASNEVSEATLLSALSAIECINARMASIASSSVA